MPQIVKPAVVNSLNELLASVQTAYKSSTHWQEIAGKAYPPPPPEPKKPKKEKKDKGTKAPAKNVQTQPDGSVHGQDKEQVDVGSSTAEAMRELDITKKKVLQNGS